MTDVGRFLEAVALHEMEISLDNGLHRHLTFKKPKTFNQHFHLTTWPGYLAFSGDMGSFVFARLPDMFSFFRADKVNPDYWSEKLQAADSRGGFEEFSFAFYRDAIERDFAGWSFETDEQKSESWREIEQTLLDDPDKDIAVRNAIEYSCSVTKQRFVDFWDHTFTDYTWRFRWCCYAIQWGIAQYDVAKGAQRFAAEVAGRCLTTKEQKAQGERCGCRGADDYCPCQNVPNQATRGARSA
ncbi:hypothetical protein [Mesorhizobium sp.]|uniref:hypothetical protein n=1 Tax=Mesorhizobium sp. TaxID=1871066 RepID=UPI000FE780C7|nr:hypothetical protein [Mesorhizobium sp.]RWP64875.1 MAG: hypothetical protein EOR08_08145 [Mesorhizobium sp.]RWQ56527.1 MAG: hypothetical protein EOS82_03255 [Mesorhizobium sp.]